MELLLPIALRSMSLRASDPGLYQSFQQALNSSYIAQAEFWPWAKPHTTEDEARQSLQRAMEQFQSEAGERRLFIVADDGRTIIG